MLMRQDQPSLVRAQQSGIDCCAPNLINPDWVTTRQICFDQVQSEGAPQGAPMIR